MPARKTDSGELPHHIAIELAPDSPERQAALAEVRRILAGTLEPLQLEMDIVRGLLGRYRDQPVPEPGAARDPGLITTSQALRLLARAEVLRRTMYQAREAACRQARALVFQQTGRLVGPRRWPGEEPRVEEIAAPVETVVSTPAAETAAPAPAQAEALPDPFTVPATNRFIQYALEKMLRGGCPKAARRDVARRAHEENWSVGQLYQQAQLQIQIAAATTGGAPATT